MSHSLGENVPKRKCWAITFDPKFTKEERKKIIEEITSKYQSGCYSISYSFYNSGHRSRDYTELGIKAAWRKRRWVDENPTHPWAIQTVFIYDPPKGMKP